MRNVIMSVLPECEKKIGLVTSGVPLVQSIKIFFLTRNLKSTFVFDQYQTSNFIFNPYLGSNVAFAVSPKMSSQNCAITFFPRPFHPRKCNKFRNTFEKPFINVLKKKKKSLHRRFIGVNLILRGHRDKKCIKTSYI